MMTISSLLQNALLISLLTGVSLANGSAELSPLDKNNNVATEQNAPSSSTTRSLRRRDIGGPSSRNLYHDQHSSNYLTANLVNPDYPNDCINYVCGQVSFSNQQRHQSWWQSHGLTTVSYSITGLTPGLHGLHIHELPVQPDCASTGGHWNPTMVNHGTPLDAQRHYGDMGNVLADENGVAEGSLLAYIPLGRIRGLAVVVHAGQDDRGHGGNDGSRATGNAGGRPACGTIRWG